VVKNPRDAEVAISEDCKNRGVALMR
jgi:hypothetical protein